MLEADGVPEIVLLGRVLVVVCWVLGFVEEMNKVILRHISDPLQHHPQKLARRFPSLANLALSPKLRPNDPGSKSSL
jgi:hypothetical protein